jgi:hypothetical protein
VPLFARMLPCCRRQPSWFRSAVAAAALFGLAACGPSRTAGPDRAEVLLSATEPRRVGCVVEPHPEELPSVAAVVDSVALASSVQELLQQDPAPTGYVLLTLAFDPAGTNIRRSLIEHSTRPAVADSIQRLVFAARRQLPEAEHEWGVRLRIDLQEPLVMRTGRREFCPPMARDRALDAAIHSLTPTGVRQRGVRRERVVRVRAVVSEAGIITSARIVRGELAGSALERDLAQHLRQFLFNPATIDGVPTTGWVEIPVRVQA